MLQVLDLFSGIGGISLGLSRSKRYQTQCFCEVDPFCRAVIHKHWPEALIHPDVTQLTSTWLQDNGVQPTVVCGGFPCQDISVGGPGTGLDGARSGLWKEYARLIGEVRPRYVIVENVPAICFRGLDRVLRDLAFFGYDAEWDCFPNGIPYGQLRSRFWLVAYPSGTRLANGSNIRKNRKNARGVFARVRPAFIFEGIRFNPRLEAHARLGGTIHGIPQRMDRIKALGNSVIPQVAEEIGRALHSFDRDHFKA